MTNPNTDTTPATGTGTEAEATPAPQPEATPSDVGAEREHEGAAALGDPGKKALAAMKQERNAARQETAAVKAAYEKLLAEHEGRQAEYEAQQQAQKIKDEALAAANRRIALAELRAAAKGKLADPSDAATFIDVSAIEVGENGEVDTAAVEALVAKLITDKPYLAAQSKPVVGSADGGARNGQAVSQLTREDVEKLSAQGRYADIVQAEREGRLANLTKTT